MGRVDPQHAVARNGALRRAVERHLTLVPLAGDTSNHVLKADLVQVESDPAHHRVLARSPYSARPHPAAFVQADLATGQALLTEPAPPLDLILDHLLLAGVQRVVESGLRLGAVEAGFDDIARRVWVLVDQRAERVTELVHGDQRSLRRATGRGRLGAADAAVGERVEDRQRLHAVRRGWIETAQRGLHVVLEDPIVGLVAGLTWVDAGLVIVGVIHTVQRRRTVRRAAGEWVGQPVGVPQPQRRVLGVDRTLSHAGVTDSAVWIAAPAVRVAAHAVVDRGDLNGVHVDVVAVGPVWLGRPEHGQVSVDIAVEQALLIVLIAVAHDDQVQALGRRSGDLNRMDRRLRQWLGRVDRGCLADLGRIRDRGTVDRRGRRRPVHGTEQSDQQGNGCSEGDRTSHRYLFSKRRRCSDRDWVLSQVGSGTIAGSDLLFD